MKFTKKNKKRRVLRVSLITSHRLLSFFLAMYPLPATMTIPKKTRRPLSITKVLIGYDRTRAGFLRRARVSVSRSLNKNPSTSRSETRTALFARVILLSSLCARVSKTSSLIICRYELCDDLHRTIWINLYFSIFLFNCDTVQSLSFSNIDLINDNIKNRLNKLIISQSSLRHE